MHLDVDLGDEFCSSFVDAVRSIRHRTSAQLGRQLMECVLSSLQEIQQQGIRERNQRLRELEDEIWHFRELWATGGRTLSAAATMKDQLYAELWSELGEPTGQEAWARGARFYVDLKAKLIMREELKAFDKREALTLDWLADTVNLALTARICCRSIGSGHTSSSWESVGVPVAA